MTLKQLVAQLIDLELDHGDEEVWIDWHGEAVAPAVDVSLTPTGVMVEA